MSSQDQAFCLKWNNHHSNLKTQFSQLFESSQHTDVTIACEGQFIKAHKVILSASSPYFNQLFVNNPTQYPIVILRDFKFNDIEEIMNYVYRGEVYITNAQLASFLKTATDLQIKGLNTEAENDDDNQTGSYASKGESSPRPKRRRQRRSSGDEMEFRSSKMLIDNSTSSYSASPLSSTSRVTYKEQDYGSQASTTNRANYKEPSYPSLATSHAAYKEQKSQNTSHAIYKEQKSQASTTSHAIYKEQKPQASTTSHAIYKEQKAPASTTSRAIYMEQMYPSPASTVSSKIHMNPQASQSLNRQTSQQSNMDTSYDNNTQEILEVDDDDCIIEDMKPIIPLSSSVDLPSIAKSDSPPYSHDNETVTKEPAIPNRRQSNETTENQFKSHSGNQYDQSTTSLPHEREFIEDTESFTVESEFIDDSASFNFENEPLASGIKRLPPASRGARSEPGPNEMTFESENEAQASTSQASTSQASGAESMMLARMNDRPLKRSLDASTSDELSNYDILMSPLLFYRCSFCSYKSPRKYNLQVHERKHTGDRPYECTICLKYKAVTAQNLRKHMEIHKK